MGTMSTDVTGGQLLWCEKNFMLFGLPAVGILWRSSCGDPVTEHFLSNDSSNNFIIVIFILSGLVDASVLNTLENLISMNLAWSETLVSPPYFPMLNR